ncbi:ABC transporter substrate-binding protein [Paenibacillus nuruki]|nr:ABC transporter substrate-binding protein [Paenibacillus nuruki]
MMKWIKQSLFSMTKLRLYSVLLSLMILMIGLISYGVYRGGLSSLWDDGQNTISSTDLSAPESISISFWTPFSGGDISFMNELVQRYNRENTDHIVVTMKNNKSDDYYTKLSTAIVTEEAPDVAIVHASMFAQYIPAGFIQNIDKFAAKAQVHFTDFNPSILARTMVNEQHYAIPLDTHFSILYYNKKWLAKAGLYQNGKVQMQPGEQGFVDFLQKLQQHIPQDVAPLAVPNVRIDSLWLWWSLYAQIDGGGQLYTSDGTRASVNMPAAKKSLELVTSLYDQQLIPPNINDASNEFAQGKAALLFLGVWSIGSFEKVPDLDFGVMPFPQIYDHAGSWGDAHTLAFPTHHEQDPQKVLAAIKFANWLARHGAIWGEAGHVPAVQAEALSPAYLSLPFRKEYVAEANHVEYFPSHPKQIMMSDALINELEKIWYGKQSVDQMLNHLEPLINQILKE